VFAIEARLPILSRQCDGSGAFQSLDYVQQSSVGKEATVGVLGQLFRRRRPGWPDTSPGFGIGHDGLHDSANRQGVNGAGSSPEHSFSDLFVAHLLARNIRFEADQVDQLFNSSEKRPARILLLLAQFGKDGKPETVIPKISQESLAETVGTTRSRVSFFMNRFRNSDSSNTTTAECRCTVHC
jgi:hypothetical protein